MNRIFSMVVFVILLAACNSKPVPLYQSDAFTVLPDGVVQGSNTAKVHSSTHISSNYKSPASENFSRLILYKFSLNEKDNEAPAGGDHWVLIDQEKEAPLVRFGEAPPARPDIIPTSLPTNYEYTFRVDMRSVLEQMESKGYYEAFDGSRIAQSDFKGVFIAGNAEPLSWDFVNLQNKGLQLNDADGDGIYEITLVLNPYDPSSAEEKEWIMSVDASAKPQYKSDQVLVDALYNLSLEEAILNIEPDSTLRTGAKWGGVWTRDISYSILLAFAYHEPEIAKISLMKKVNRDRIVQDTGSGGAWPVSSDRTTWCLAAWELYKVTGDQAWLQTAYSIIKNTLEDDYKTLQSATGMYKGESSFLDWREQTYPKWMSNMDIYVSENLGTNVVHYQAHRILASMARELNLPFQEYENRAEQIKKGINASLWMPDAGYYAQYLYGRQAFNQSPRFEALGEALAVLFEVADPQQAESIFLKSPITEYGITCIFPQITGIPPYHNNGIWPFVQAYWNWAAAKAGNEEVLSHGLVSIYRAGALFLSNYENFVAQSGDFLGTEINSHRMLWSMAGNLAMVHRVFIGMQFDTDGLRFNPVIPQEYGGTRTLENFHYRNTKLHITVKGFGNQIQSVAIDGKKVSEAFIPTDWEGEHQIEIVMANNSFKKGRLNLVENQFALVTPLVKQNDFDLRWDAIEGAVQYRVYKNGQMIKEQSITTFSATESGEYQITAVDQHGVASFYSEPQLLVRPEQVQIIELESVSAMAQLPYVNFSGKGFVEVSTEKNKELIINIQVPEAGRYLVDLRYSNGTGPWNTDNNCAIRSVYVNEQYQGVFVLPQRGTNEWSDWGFSNAHQVNLNQGKNQLTIRYDEWNTNMDVAINTAMIDYLRVIRW